jgi:Ser/Thr protein kinase RdoA (MazF antagonist)
VFTEDLLRGLNRPDIRREKPGYSDAYYALLEQLEHYAALLLSHLGLVPQHLSGGPGETGAVLRVQAGSTRVVIRINVWEGELYTSTVFFRKLEGTGVPTPEVLHFDASKCVLPYEYQVLEWLPGQDLSHLPPHLHRQAGYLMGQALRRMHRVPVEGFGAPLPAGGWSAASWREALQATYGAELSPEHTRALFSEELVQRIEAQTLANPVLDIPTPHLIHSDMGEGNGLYALEEGQLSLVGVVDPGSIQATIGLSHRRDRSAHR